MRMTLLEMVQDILSDMNSDQVNSWDDTVESMQVAQIIRRTYFDIVSTQEYDEVREQDNLIGSGNVNRPHVMTIPVGMYKIDWIRYNKKLLLSDPNKWEEVKYLPVSDFMDVIYARDPSATNVTAYTVGDSEHFIRTDAHPTYWTSLDDFTIWFDSFYSTLDDTLQTSKSLVQGSMEPTFTLQDNFYAELRPDLFPFLLAEAKSKCFALVMDNPNVKVEQEARRKRIEAQFVRGLETQGFEYRVNYGRK